jgi:hypothetical protein
MLVVSSSVCDYWLCDSKVTRWWWCHVVVGILPIDLGYSWILSMMIIEIVVFSPAWIGLGIGQGHVCCDEILLISPVRVSLNWVLLVDWSERLCQRTSSNVCGRITRWSMAGVSWHSQHSLIWIIIAGWRDRFKGLVGPDRVLSLRDIVHSVVVWFLHLEIPAAAIFHVYSW